MANEINFNVNFAEAAKWEPYTGFGSAALFRQDGIFKFTIVDVKPALTKKNDPKFDLVLRCEDADEKGQVIYGQVMAGGTDKNGNPLSRQLWDLVASLAGATPEKVKGMAAIGTQGAAAVVGLLKGKTCHAEVRAESYTNPQTGVTATTSRPENFVAEIRYTEAVAIGAHRRERASLASVATPAVPAQPGVPAGAIALAQPAFGGAAAPAAAPAVNGAPAPAAVDPLAQLKALGL